MDIVCVRCRLRGEGDPLIAIREDDSVARCRRCGRRYRIFTGDLSRAAEEKKIDYLRSNYLLHLAPAERLPQRWRLTAQPQLRFDRGHRYTLVLHRGRLLGFADQTTGEWIVVPENWSKSWPWRFAWTMVALVVLANLLLQLSALRGFLDEGGAYWAVPILALLVAVIFAGKWLMAEQRIER